MVLRQKSKIELFAGEMKSDKNRNSEFCLENIFWNCEVKMCPYKNNKGCQAKG